MQMFGSFLFISILLFAGLSPYQNETASLCFFSYIGIITHYLKKWADLTEAGEKLKPVKAIPTVILSIVTATVFISIRDELKSVFVFTKLSSFIIGYSGSSIFFSFIDKKLKDYVNKKQGE